MRIKKYSAKCKQNEMTHFDGNKAHQNSHLFVKLSRSAFVDKIKYSAGVKHINKRENSAIPNSIDRFACEFLLRMRQF